ncbi:MAG: type IV pilus assembly protein PilM [Phycisphaeraceae bacterium]|nr:type IV pilus assembly protein PilM [Phycisphaeraceae bacterium]
MASNVCWGIEVGAGAIKAVKLQRDGDGVSLQDFAVIPHKRVLSAPETDEKEAKRVGLGTLVSQHDISKAGIAVSVAGHSAYARFAKLPPVEPKKIPDIVKFEAVQQIPFPIDDVEWDFQTFASADNPDIEVGIFAMTRERVMEKIGEWSDFGRVPDVLTLSPLAAYNAIAFDQQFTEATPGTVIVDIGTTSTDLIVSHAGRLWIRTFPIGGHQFTEALVTAFNLSYVKAEKLKREAETSQHARHILQAMRPVFGDLAQDVQRSIGYYNSLHRDAKITRLIGLGSTFNLPGLRKFLSQQLGLEVVRLEGFNRIKLENAERQAALQENAMTLATAYGLALQGLGLQTVNANLMPIAVAREAMWKDKTKWFAAAASILLVAGGASFVKPMLDRSAVAGGIKPPVVDQTKAQVKRLKKDWTDAEASYKPDPSAPGTLRLTDHRDVYPRLVDDLGRLMAGATKVAAEAPKAPKVIFDRFETDYPTAGGGGPGGPLDPLGRGGDPGAAGVAAKPMVHATLTIRIATTASDSETDALVDKAFLQWLAANAKRDTAPYTFQNVQWKAIQRETIAAPVAAADPNQPGGTPSAPPSAQPPSNPLGNPGRRQPQVLGGGPGTGERPPMPTPTPGGGGPGGSAPPTQEEVNKIAPIPPVPPVGAPGTRISTYQIQWDAPLTYTEKKEPQQ